MCVTVCGTFVPDEGVVAGYDNRIRDKIPAKWGVQIVGMILGARSNLLLQNICKMYTQTLEDPVSKKETANRKYPEI